MLHFVDKKPLKFHFQIGLAILMVMLMTSFILRRQDFREGVGIRNLEATYHVLLTIKAMQSNPIKDHWFLPIVTLGGKMDKEISWGATVPTPKGDYIYTSFTPPGFLAPYLVFKCFHISPSIENLCRFNVVLNTIVSIVLYSLLYQLLISMNYDPWKSVSGALIGSFIGIFSNEALTSHGLIYWSQSLYQLLLVISLWLIFKYISANDADQKTRARYSCLIVILTFLGAWTEWTGYVFGLGVGLLFWIGFQRKNNEKKLAIWIISSLIGAGALTFVHYGMVIGFKPEIQALFARFMSRNIVSGNPFKLIGHLFTGYFRSFELYFILFIIMFCVQLVWWNKKYLSDPIRQRVVFLFVAASIPLIENVIMLQHAWKFSFDRLKFIFPAALIFAISFCRLPLKFRVILAGTIILASVTGYKLYQRDLNKHAAWTRIDAANRALAKKIFNLVDKDCAVFVTNWYVRAYPNLLFNRGIYERRSFENSIALMKEKNACAAVYLEGDTAFTDLPKYRQAIITYPNGKSIMLSN